MDNSSGSEQKIFEYPEGRRVAEKPPVDQTSQILVLLDTWRSILNARLLAVLALIGALAIFGFTTSDPTALRLWGCAGYSVGVLWPIIWLYCRRSE